MLMDSQPAAPVEASYSCRHCGLGAFCPPNAPQPLRSRTLRVRKGAPLYAAGDPCEEVYAVHSGAFKSVLSDADGRTVVCGFRFPGDVLGLEASALGRHATDMIALEASDVCVVPLPRTEGADAPQSLQRQFTRLVAGALLDRNAAALVHATLDSDARLAWFLATLARRFASRGLDVARLRLPMSRVDIAAYLGLTPETVSRSFSTLQEEGLVRVSARNVEVRNLQGLEARSREKN